MTTSGAAGGAKIAAVALARRPLGYHHCRADRGRQAIHHEKWTASAMTGRKKIAFQGELGANSHLACQN
ncbi:hypothetical protein, partial [Frankia sp. Cr1]|uniref:hypothetical protein n=1 Tax=Frankia sp. Cr1 TaxID=3073931 RepID=UPI002AD2C35E